MAFNSFLKALLLSIFFIPFSIWAQSNASFTDMPMNALETFRKYISTDLFYTHDYISNTGGAKAGPRNISALDLYFESDFSKFSDLKGHTQLHYIHVSPNDNRGSIGDSQYASNIDMPEQVDRIVDLWYEHEWNDQFKTLLGLHDISMEFNITESSLTFLNTAFGTGTEICYSGVNGASVYPLTALGFRSLYHFSEELSLRTGIYDADPGDSSTYRSFHSDIGAHEGIMHISELAYQDDNQKLGWGGWNYSKAQEQFGTDKTTTLYGAYGMYERKLSHSISSFIRYGWANPLVNEIQGNWATGLTYQGLLQKKKINDSIGLGVTNVHFSRQYMKQLALDENSSFSSSETAYEAYYQFKPIEHLSLRPDVQYITNPSGLEKLKNAWAMGLRTVVEI